MRRWWIGAGSLLLALSGVAHAQAVDPECVNPPPVACPYDGTAPFLKWCTPTVSNDGAAAVDGEVAYCEVRIDGQPALRIDETRPGKLLQVALPTGLFREQSLEVVCCRDEDTDGDGVLDPFCGRPAECSAIRFPFPAPGQPALVSP